MLAFLASITVTITLLILIWMVGALRARVNKLDKNQATMLGYFDTINRNEQTLRDDIQKLYNEYRNIKEKTSQSRPIGPQAKKSV